jgi:hypothetical protein
MSRSIVVSVLCDAGEGTGVLRRIDKLSMWHFTDRHPPSIWYCAGVCKHTVCGFSIVLAIQPRTGATVGRSAEDLARHGVALGESRISTAPSAPGINARRAIAGLAIPYQALHRYPPKDDCVNPSAVSMIAAVAAILSAGFSCGCASSGLRLRLASIDNAACKADPAWVRFLLQLRRHVPEQNRRVMVPLGTA